MKFKRWLCRRFGHAYRFKSGDEVIVCRRCGHREEAGFGFAFFKG
jgi:hypothetical protein